LVAAGVKFVAEGSNMGCTQEAIDVFEAAREASNWVWYAPGSESPQLNSIDPSLTPDFAIHRGIQLRWCRSVWTRDGPELAATDLVE
jgi:hypothetical protein